MSSMANPHLKPSLGCRALQTHIFAISSSQRQLRDDIDELSLKLSFSDKMAL